MSTVSRPPSSSVFWTSSTELRIHVELSEIILVCTPAGSVRFSSTMALCTSSAIWHGVAARDLAHLDGDGALAVHEGDVALLLLRVLDAGDVLRWMGVPPRVVTTTLAKSFGFWMRPLMRTRSSRAPFSTRPAGTSAFSRCRAAITMSGEMPRAFMRSGRSRTWISRRRPPTTDTLPTPGMFSMRRLMVSSARRVRSRIAQPSPRTEKLMMGRLWTSKRWMIGGSMSVGRSARMASDLGADVRQRVHDLDAQLELDEDHRVALGGHRLHGP